MNSNGNGNGIGGKAHNILKNRTFLSPRLIHLWIISIGSFIVIDWHCHIKPISVKTETSRFVHIKDSMGCNVCVMCVV